MITSGGITGSQRGEHGARDACELLRHLRDGDTGAAAAVLGRADMTQIAELVGALAGLLLDLADAAARQWGSGNAAAYARALLDAVISGDPPASPVSEPSGQSGTSPPEPSGGDIRTAQLDTLTAFRCAVTEDLDGAAAVLRGALAIQPAAAGLIFGEYISLLADVLRDQGTDPAGWAEERLTALRDAQ